MTATYISPGLTLSVGAAGQPVRELQTDLRRLGYLASGLDGHFGDATARAIRALQIDLLGLGGKRSPDSLSPFAITSFNAGNLASVTAVTGALDQPLAKCIAALLADPRAGWVPRSDDPAAQNHAARDALAHSRSTAAPSPFLLAMAIQESGVQHFHVPIPADPDDFVIIGLDRNDKTYPDRITSRGYGLGQYTFFHHPLTPAEIQDLVLDPSRNLQHAFQELRQKFDLMVTGPVDHADDRAAEHPGLASRPCRYAPADTRYLADCRVCARQVPTTDIHRGTPHYEGASQGYQPDQYYPSAEYLAVPNRAAFLCDWAYASRRYNGSGNDSFHYQCRILLNLAALPASIGN